MAGRWNPWRTLRERPNATLEWTRRCGDRGFVEVTLDDVGRVRSETVVLDLALDRRERRAVLAHELVHLERGVLPAGTPGAVVEREEHQVRVQTATRLVPAVELAEFVATRSTVGPVTVADVADEFDVPSWIATTALGRLPAVAAPGRNRPPGGG